MSNKMKELEAYTQAGLAVADFKRKHADVFEEYEQLLIVQTEAEAALKDVVRQNQTNIANDFVKVTYSPAFKKYYDADFLMDKATPRLQTMMLKMKAITYQVDKPIFEDMVEKGIVPIELKVEAFREEAMTPKVLIKENYNAKTV